MYLVRHNALTWRPPIVQKLRRCEQRLSILPAGELRLVFAALLGHTVYKGHRQRCCPARLSATMSASESRAEETACEGEVFLYDQMLGYAGFEARSGPVPAEGSKAVVCIGGLTDGLLSLRYLPPLASELRQVGWRTFQPVLQSSYRGWGFASLDDDAAGIDKFLSFLHANRGISEVVLLGSSTGCQDAVHYLKVGQFVNLVTGIVLQAPVSDREALEVEAAPEHQVQSLHEFAELATKMISEGRGDEVLPRDACQLFGPPDVITAYRFDSLTRRLADDDMFSSDLSDDELKQKLGHVHVPALLVASADDEYVPKSVDPSMLCRRMGDAMAAGVAETVQTLVLEQGGHGVRGQKAQVPFLDGVVKFVTRLDTASSSRSLSRLTWEVDLARTLKERAAAAPAGQPFVVALAGMPGSGKSRASQILLRLLQPDCLVVQMDGFHTKLADLQSRLDAQSAVYRRGAPDTFDVAALQEALQRVRSGPVGQVWFPSFDHVAGPQAAFACLQLQYMCDLMQSC